ncbi:Tubby-related protein 3 [Liparis tanakae]|uniref:Tubby-related protein 3 n=1 Tax=Liparis tanakae TaxID=230148 RepID=A0A4Z2FM74_9TELE|nr:Tubby-related protein 3 [Liparis tanakae]
MEEPDLRQQKLEHQRTLLMKKQQKKRKDSQMVVANRDARLKSRRPRAARGDETPLLSAASPGGGSLADQVEHAHDNPLGEITLDEIPLGEITLDEIPLDEITLGEREETASESHLPPFPRVHVLL